MTHMTTTTPHTCTAGITASHITCHTSSSTEQEALYATLN